MPFFSTTLLAAAFAAITPQFGPTHEITVSSVQGRSIEVVDVDGDGALDFVVCTVAGDNLNLTYDNGAAYVYFGDGQGGLVERRRLTENGVGASAATTLDIDADGDLDLAVLIDRTSTVRFYRNQGGRLLDPWISVSTGLPGITVDQMVAGDVTGDGVDEVLVEGAVISLAGGAASVTALPQVTSLPHVYDVALADLDGDGDDDYVFAGFTGIHWIEATGSGLTGPLRPVPTNGETSAIATGDLDGDGDVDIVVARQHGAHFGWYPNLGTGSFGPLQLFPGTSSSADAIAVADVDGDGDLDALGAGGFDQPIVVFSGNGAGGFTMGPVLGSADQHLCIAAADLDGDADLDVVGVPEGDATTFTDKIAGLSWAENLGNGAFGATRSCTPDPRKPVLAHADLDGDGDDDVIAADFHADGGPLVVYDNDGTGGFGFTRVLYADLPPVRQLGCGDLDGDGRVDVVVRPLSGRASWHRNLGGGVLAPPVLVGPSPLWGIGLQHLELGDVDGDGDVDLLLTRYAEPVSWMVNDGSGGFSTAPTIVPQDPDVASIYVVDYDADGTNDIVVVERGSSFNPLVVYIGLGSGSFGMRQALYFDVGNVPHVLVADIDGDGLPDVTWLDTFRMFTSFNSGTSTPSHAALISGANFASVAALDVDADGGLDLVGGATWAFHPLSLFRNLGAGAFASAVPLNAAQAAVLSAVDLDGDGDQDLLASSRHFGTIVWVESTQVRPIGSSYCDPAVPNSTGSPAQLGIYTPFDPTSPLVRAVTRSVPPNSFGMYLAARDSGLLTIPGSAGRLCLDGPIGRFNQPGQVSDSGPNGVLELSLDSTALPTPTGLVGVSVGETWYFQCWFRDSGAGQGSNLSQGVEITWPY